MFQKLAPIAKYATGLFAMSLDLKSNFDEQMNMQYPTMSGEGMLSLSNTSLQNLKLMEVLADRFKLDKFKNLNLKDQKIKFAIADGKINTDSITMKLWDNTNLKLAGFSTLNQELNYNGILSIPRKDLGQSNQGLNTLLSQAQGKGLNINVDEMVNVGIKIGGTFTKPTISLDLKQSASNLVNSIVDQAKDQLKQKATETIANTKEGVKKEAREKADKILADAQLQADKIKSEAKKQADKIRSEGKNAANVIREQTDKQAAEVKAAATNQVARLAADKAAKKIVDEGYAKAQKVENEANAKADNVEAEANKRADKIMEDARNKSNETLK
jgi:vacuolar-type H+-ATPase subunit E/Vma4